MSIVIVLLIIAAIYLFLVSPRIFHKPDRTPFYGVHYAHRGLFDNASDAPENSLKAIRKAVEAGYGIEFDVQLSKDDVPVVFHDASLKRMCGVDGKVWEYTLEELQKMKLVDSDETIPTFKKVLETVGGKVPLIIEYKMERAGTKVCELGNALLEKYEGPYCIESFHPFAVKWYRDHKPEVMRGQLSENYWKRSERFRGKPLYLVLTYLLLNFLTRPDFIAYHHGDANNFSRKICSKLGALSVAYTVRSQDEYEKAKPHFELFIFDSFILK
ncbi:MAG: glycerophosphodiester phosphodiesterase [Tyzzerella sp.]|nr:glycerophosphodiester phosphodiesterase [Tyzzerella sp.]